MASAASCALGVQVQEPGDARGRRRLREEPLPGHPSVRREDLPVGHGEDRALGLLRRGDRLLPRRRVPDPDRGRDRLRILDRLPEHDRRRALRLEAEEPRRLVDHARLEVLGVAEPMARDVAGVPDRNEVQVGRAAERVADLERRGLLPLEPVTDSRCSPASPGTGPRDPSPARAMRRSCRRPRALVRRARASGPSCPSAILPFGTSTAHVSPAFAAYAAALALVLPVDAHTTAFAPSSSRLRDRERHPTVLEGPGGVRTVVLQPDVAAGLGRQDLRPDERRPSFTERDHWRVGRDRQPSAVLLDDAAPLRRTGPGGVSSREVTPRPPPG